MVAANLRFAISKLPQSVGIPCFNKSSDSCASSVVFPDPVGPVRMVSSPRRWPFSDRLRKGSERNGVPCSSRGCTRS